MEFKGHAVDKDTLHVSAKHFGKRLKYLNQ